MKKYVLTFISSIALGVASIGVAQMPWEPSPAVVAKCKKAIIERWAKTGTDQYGRSQNNFLGLAGGQMVMRGKYGNNEHLEYTVVNKDGDFNVHCVYNSQQKILGLELAFD